MPLAEVVESPEVVPRAKEEAIKPKKAAGQLTHKARNPAAPCHRCFGDPEIVVTDVLAEQHASRLVQPSSVARASHDLAHFRRNA
jgi:hypothetical protein